MKIKLLLYTIVFALISSCSAKSEYEQEARERALVAAKNLINTDHRNIMKLETAILDAKSIQSEYLLIGDTLAANTFDMVFRSYVTENDSVLAQEIF